MFTLVTSPVFIGTLAGVLLVAALVLLIWGIAGCVQRSSFIDAGEGNFRARFSKPDGIEKHLLFDAQDVKSLKAEGGRFFRTRLFVATGMLFVAFMLVFTSYSSSEEYHEALAKQIENQLSNEPIMLNDLSEGEYTKLAAGEAVDVTVGTPDGSVKTLKVTLSQPRGWFFFVTEDPIEGVTRPMAPGLLDDPTDKRGNYLKASRADQNLWVVSRALQAKYGLGEEGVEWKELRIPATEPKKFSTFGTTDLVYRSGGEYNQVRATLIWDGGYKLITRDGENRTAELPLAKE